MYVHFAHKTMAAEGTDKCSQELLPAKVISTSEICNKSEVIAFDLGRRTIASAWSPKTGFHTPQRNEYSAKGGIDLRKEQVDMRNTQLNNHEFHVLANYPSKTASLDAVRAFADV